MIRYSLVCDDKHEFEVWFRDSGDYDRQKKHDLVTCPTCGSAEVEKALMAPSLGRNSRKAGASRVTVEAPAPEPATPAAAAPAPENKTPVAIVPPQERELRAKLRELRDHLVKNSEDVGAKFPEVARKMHYGEIEHRSIYGEASPKDAKELHEEGVEFYPVPMLPDDKN